MKQVKSLLVAFRFEIILLYLESLETFCRITCKLILAVIFLLYVISPFKASFECLILSIFRFFVCRLLVLCQ